MSSKRLWESNEWTVYLNRVAYVEGIQHNLISVSQLVVGTDNQVVFNEAESIISNVETKEVLLK